MNNTVQISNYKEKQWQLGYFLSRQHDEKKRFSIENIYRYWCQFWKDDFLINGAFMPEIYKNRLVLSKKGAKMGEKQPEIINTFNDILTDTQKFLIEHYDSRKTERENSDDMRNQMFQYRRDNYKRLAQLLKDSGLDGQYYVSDKTSKKHPCYLGRYAIYKCGMSPKERSSYFGTFDEIKEIIQNGTRRKE